MATIEREALAGAAAGGGRADVPSPRPSTRSRVRRWVVTAALLVCTLVFVYPFVWLVSASFKPRKDVFDDRIIPIAPTLQNYVDVWREAPLGVWLLNTVIVTLLATVAVTITSSLVAWGFAYFEFRGRNLLFGLVLGSMMVPGAATMIPTYLIWDSVGAVGTLVPLWAGNLFASAFYVFLLRQFFLGLPRDLFLAAKSDGANNWQIFRHIALPLTKPALVVVALFEFQAAWTDLMRGLIYLRDSDTFTVPRGLKTLVDTFGFGGHQRWELIVTASVITTVPMIVVFLIGQKQIIEGISTTGTKG
jgi:multiple sugar transport system permease protein